MKDDPRQLALPLGGESPPKPKRGKKKPVLITPFQERALENIASYKSDLVVGIDEVGMGCWAGPVVVSAVVLPRDWKHPDVKDSKQLTHKKRVKALQEQIMPNALLHCTLWGDNEQIDEHGIAEVHDRLVRGCALFCRVRYPDVIVVQDGNYPLEVDGGLHRVVCLPKADELVPAVSAASILAKVTRDQYMVKMAETYPGYGFESNKGYHSKHHVSGLEALGPCPLHRKSFKPVAAFAKAHPVSSW